MRDKSDTFASMPSVDDFEERRLFAELESTMFGTGAPVQLGRYTVGPRLGSGAMGVVYEAEDPHLRRKVALKVLHPDLRATQASRGHQRLRREARSISQVSHPNVIEVYDVGEAGGRVYIAMELVDGASLDTWLSQTPRDWSEVLTVFVDAGRGLAAAHDAGVIHRDFKPSNVSIDRTGRVRVLDFGLAKAPVAGPSTLESASSVEAADVQTREDALVGTPRYMAPEQLEGKPAGERSDQYAFCVALFEALFGRVPFRESSMLASKLAADRVMAPTGHAVPRRIVRALQRGLRADLTQRWPTMHALLAQLELRKGVRPSAIVGSLGLVVVAGLAWSSGERSHRSGVTRSDRATIENPAWEDALARAHQAMLGRDLERAEALSRQVLAEAHAAGDRATAARAARSLGQALLNAGEIDKGLDVLEQGYSDAVVARADDTRAAIAAKIGHTVVKSGGVAAAERWAREVRSMAADDRISDETRLELLNMETEMALYGGDFEGALGFADKAVTLARRIEHPSLIEASYNRTVMLFRNRRLEEARAAALQLVEECETIKGADAPRTADVLMVLGGIEATMARISAPELFDEAVSHSRRSVEIYESASGVSSIELSRAELNYGNVLGYAGQYADSNVQYERALGRLQADADRQQHLIADLESGIGLNLVKLGDLPGAEAHLHRSVLALEEVLGLDHPGLFSPLQSLAMAQRQQGKLDRAKASIDRGLAIKGISDLERGPGLWEAAEIEHLRGRSEDARALAEDAARAYEASGDPEAARQVRAWADETKSR